MSKPKLLYYSVLKYQDDNLELLELFDYYMKTIILDPSLLDCEKEITLKKDTT